MVFGRNFYISEDYHKSKGKNTKALNFYYHVPVALLWVPSLRGAPVIPPGGGVFEERMGVGGGLRRTRRGGAHTSTFLYYIGVLLIVLLFVGTF